MPAPFHGKQFRFVQDDGSTFDVIGWGNQHYAIFETLDGYTIVENLETFNYEIARLSENGEYLVPSGIRADLATKDAISEIDKHLRPSRRQIHETIKQEKANLILTQRTALRRENKKGIRFDELQLEAPPSSATVGSIVGLCLLIDFSDDPASIGRTKIEQFCNQPSFNGDRNAGSVFDYFFANSMGRLEYTNIVTEYVRVSKPRSYYDNPRMPWPRRAQEMITEALEELKRTGFGFDSLSYDEHGYLLVLNVFYAGELPGRGNRGLWPHSSTLHTAIGLGSGLWAQDYQITNIGSELSLGTFCHESGHLMCDFPDLYDSGEQSFGTGIFCLMSYGGTGVQGFEELEKRPAQTSAYLKFKAGWADNIYFIQDGDLITLSSERNDFAVFAKSETEYFIIENRHNSGWDELLPGAGLLIWHVDETGSNEHEQGTPSQHFELSLEQADGKEEIENALNFGDEKDFFHRHSVSVFSPTSRPNSNWWDDSVSGLKIFDVSENGGDMTFRVSAPRRNS